MNFSFAGKSLVETSEQKNFCVPIQNKKSVENIANGNKLKNERKNINVHTTNLEFIKRIEIWIRENSKGVIYDNIMIQEVQCLKEGCVPIETVIVLSCPKNDIDKSLSKVGSDRKNIEYKKNYNYLFKIFKPLKEVELEEITQILRTEKFDNGNNADNIHLITKRTHTVNNNDNNDDPINTIELTHDLGCPCCDVNSGKFLYITQILNMLQLSNLPATSFKNFLPHPTRS
jgi:hypothetical protein